jgi:uracil-DNA glycosylase
VNNPVVLPYLPAGVESAAIRMVAVGEALTESGHDFLSAPSDSMFVSNVVAAFQSAGADIHSIDDVVSLGVYLTVAVKAPKLTATIPTATVDEHALSLAAELDVLTNLRVIVLMGDVAIKAMNAVARQRGMPRVIPPGPTYKLRDSEHRYGEVRVLPSYLPTGKSYLIERSKREMIAEDLRVALLLMSS